MGTTRPTLSVPVGARQSVSGSTLRTIPPRRLCPHWHQPARPGLVQPEVGETGPPGPARPGQGQGPARTQWHSPAGPAYVTDP